MPVNRFTAFISAVIAAVAIGSPAAHAGPAVFATLDGATWIGPHNNVKVQTRDCGGRLCGWVVWATPDAEQDARDGGVQKLVGVELLHQYQQTSANRWQGQVFVPDMGRTFYSTIARIESSQLKISGCILGGLICKSQIWRRV